MDKVNLLGEKLKQLRGGRSLNQVASESGIDRGQLWRYERGRIPDDDLIAKLAEYYGVAYDELKGLCFEILYPPETRQRAAILKWAQQQSQ